MHIAYIDIETNAIDDWLGLSDLEKVHCLCVMQNGGEGCLAYNSQRGDIERGLELIKDADIIVGHNIQKFDLPALKKLYGFNPTGCVRDTLLMSRLVYPDQRNDDFKLSDLPKKLIGSHSLKAWGHRLKLHKGEYGEGEGCWDQWSQDMEDYCARDVAVTKKLYLTLIGQSPSSDSVILEHDFAECIRKQEIHGFRFDTESAQQLHTELLVEKSKMEAELRGMFDGVQVPMKKPAYWECDGQRYETKTQARSMGCREKDIVRGPNKIKTIPFNPGSRDQIAQAFIRKYGWKPQKFTGEGKPQIDESVLASLNFVEAPMLLNYLTVGKRLGQLAEGKEAWMKNNIDGRIHGSVNTNGAVSGRCTHSRPNVSQVPSVGAPYGYMCRSLFQADEGHVLVGCDASGLELRMLAHYLAFADGGSYAKLVTEGDPHTANQEAAGLPTRSAAKTFIYALIYGSGDQNLGKLVGGGSREGKEMRSKFLDGMPAFKKLKKAIDHSVSTKGYLLGLDGRKLPVRSKHSALNLRLQSAGAVVMKRATVTLGGYMNRMNQHKSESNMVRQVAHVHDEVQLTCPMEVSHVLGNAACRSIIDAGSMLSLSCPLDAEYKVGSNWAETH
jgi:DNA polymerase-1